MADRKDPCLFLLVVFTVIWCFVRVEIVEGTDIDVSRIFTDDQIIEKNNGSKCSCASYNCGCCAHLEWDKVGLNNTVCTNVTYLPDEYGVSLIVTVDGAVWYNETVSLKNPPPMCFGVPYLKKLAKLCVRFYDMDIKDHKFSGCVRLEARLEGLVVDKYDLGCFKIPPTKHITSEETSLVSRDLGTGCSCLYYDCGCCVDVTMFLLGQAVDTACANLTFLPQTSEVSVALSFDKVVYFKKVIPVRNPPPVCFKVPYLTTVQACVQLYQLDNKDAQLTGCVRLLEEDAGKIVERLDLGCFKWQIPVTNTARSSLRQKKMDHETDVSRLLFLAYEEAKKEKRVGGI